MIGGGGDQGKFPGFDSKLQEFVKKLQGEILWKEYVAKKGIVCFQFMFGIARGFVGLLVNYAPHRMIKGWGCSLGSLMARYSGWCGRQKRLTAMTRFSCLCGRVQSPLARHVTFQEPLSQAMAALPPGIWCTPSHREWEEEWKYNATITSERSKHRDVDWMFGIYHSWHMFWGHAQPTIVLRTRAHINMEIPAPMPSSTSRRFQIYGRMNCTTVPNWPYITAHSTK